MELFLECDILLVSELRLTVMFFRALFLLPTNAHFGELRIALNNYFHWHV